MKILKPLPLKELVSYLPSLVPLAVVSIFLIASTGLIYGHLKLTPKTQNTPAARYGNNLIDWHLKSAGHRVSSTTQTVTISLTEESTENIELLTSTTEENASPHIYMNVISKVISQNPYHMIINWNPVRELTQDEIKTFKDIFSKNPGKLSLYAHKDHYKSALSNFSKVVNVKLSDFCAGSLYSICPFQTDWKFWNINDLLTQFATTDTNKIVSSQLHPKYETFIIRQDQMKNVPDYSFSSIISDFQAIQPDTFRDKVVFVGSDLTQGLKGMTHPYKIDKVASYDNQSPSEIRIDGTPTHKFWANITRMFIDNDFTKIASPNLTTSMAILLGVMSLISSLVLGPFSALIVFIFQTMVVNIIAIILLKNLNFYLPLFKGLYLSSILFILGGFLKLIIENIREKHIQIKDRNIVESSDIKGNFISLISHNLNTPVAKMISLMENAKPELSEEVVKSCISPCLEDASLIQLCFRSVLATNRLEESNINKEILSSDRMIEEITFEVSPILSRLGIILTHEDETDNPEERFFFDRRVLIPVISAVTYLLLSNEENSSKSFFLTIEFNSDDNAIHLEWTTSNITTLLINPSSKPDFTEQACQSLLTSLLKRNDCALKITKEDDGNSIKLKVGCLPD
jgi:hypothetical protein